MTTKVLLFALLPAAYGSQVAVVDLSGVRAGSAQGQSHCYIGSGGGVYDGPANWKSPDEVSVRLVLTRIVATKEGTQVRYAVEAVMTNTGDKPIPIPIGKDADTLLAPENHDRYGLVFTAALAQGRKDMYESMAVSASNASHPESSTVLGPGDAAVFLLPVGSWPTGKEPQEEISLSVRRERKTIAKGVDCVEGMGQPIHSENSLPLQSATKGSGF
jgi:hypothetical protein